MNINNDYQNLLSAVRSSSHEEAMEAFEKIRDINARNPGGESNILHYMISNFKRETLRTKDFEKLIQLGVEVNAKNKEGHTPLHYTVMHPVNYEMAKILLNSGAIIDEQDATGNTALWIAVSSYRGEKEMLDLIFLLLRNGADIDKKNIHGNSARDIIVRRQKSILDGGANKDWDLGDHLHEYLKTKN